MTRAGWIGVCALLFACTEGVLEREPVPAEVPDAMEMEMEPPETMDPVDPPPMDPPPTDPPPTDPPPTDPPPDMPPPAGMPCVHSFGGVYEHLGCSMSYQCVDGAWRMRAPDAVCVCVEPTGLEGCTSSGTPIEPMPMPPGRTDSESIGSPSSGRQERAMRVTMPMAASYVVADTGRDAYFGTEETIYWLRTGFDRVAFELPGAALPQLRDISVEAGGVPAGSWPHSSHESGRDADVTYYLHTCSDATGCPLADVALVDFDAAATWALFEVWIRAGVVTYIFVDHGLQAPLYEEAMRRGATAAELARWFQYPRAVSERVGLVRHVDNHRNHFHVRFTCPADDLDCIE